MTVRLKPLNDFIFHKLFGETANKDLLIGFLNAVLQANIQDVTIEQRELQRETIEDKLGILDIKATLANGEKYNIEVQLLDPKNMVQRTLFYWSKLYTENFERGIHYNRLKRTVTINLLDFSLKELENESFHSCFQLKEKKTMNTLTDLMEIHFIEMPKFRRVEIDLRNPLHCWLAFLNKDIPEEILEEVKNVEPLVRKAEEHLAFLSSDPKTIEQYHLRERAIADERSRMEGSKEEGRAEEKEEIAKAMLQEGVPFEQILKFTKVDENKLGLWAKEVADKLERHSQ